MSDSDILKNEQVDSIKDDIRYLFTKIDWKRSFIDSRCADIVGSIFENLDRIKQNDN